MEADRQAEVEAAKAKKQQLSKISDNQEKHAAARAKNHEEAKNRAEVLRIANLEAEAAEAFAAAKAELAKFDQAMARDDKRDQIDAQRRRKDEEGGSRSCRYCANIVARL